MECPYTADECCEITKKLMAKNEYKQDAYMRPTLYKSAQKVGPGLYDNEDSFMIVPNKMGDYIDNDMYELISTKDSHNLMRYKYDTSFAYAVNDEIKDWSLVSYKPFLNQQNFVTSSTGVNDVFEEVKVSEKSEIKSITTKKDNLIGDLDYKLAQGESSITLTLDNELQKNIYNKAGS